MADPSVAVAVNEAEKIGLNTTESIGSPVTAHSAGSSSRIRRRSSAFFTSG